MLLNGCKGRDPSLAAPIVDGNAAATDPASVNLLPAPVAGTAPVGYVGGQPRTRVAASSYAAPQQQGYAETYPQQGSSQQNEAYRYNTTPPSYNGQGYGYSDPQANANEYDQYQTLLDPGDVAATQPPPPLPDYQQPEAPGPDYLWTPGYWDYANTGYYYVPGSWVSAPYQGALWTPGWWGYGGDRYHWHHGYWGRHVGYYGGINYGFGYIGFGYQGGYWNGDHFFYNRAVNRVQPRYVNNYTYDRRVEVTNNSYINNTRVSYYGGSGGLRRGPAPQEFAALHEQRTPPMQAQIQNRREAESNRQQFFSANNGRPAMLYAAHALTADRNVVAPPRAAGIIGAPGQQQGFNNGRVAPGQQPGAPNAGGNIQRGGFGAALPANANPQQRQQFEQQQRQGMEAQRQQQQQQRAQAEQQQQQQHTQQEQQRTQQMQQRQQADVQRQQQQQVQQQQRVQQEQQRTQQMQQRQQADVQRQQQQQVQQQQRVQQEQQRTQQMQQREQADVQRQQQQQVQQQQRVQQEQQRTQQMQQRQQADAQRQQQQQQRVQQEQQRTQQMQQRQQQQMQQARPAAPAPHAESPHAAAPQAAPHGGGGGEHPGGHH